MSGKTPVATYTVTHGWGSEGETGEWVASTLQTTSEHGLSSITTADAHTSAASNRLNWRPSRFKWLRPFRRKTKSGFCACAITFQLASIAKSINSGPVKPIAMSQAEGSDMHAWEGNMLLYWLFSIQPKCNKIAGNWASQNISDSPFVRNVN